MQYDCKNRNDCRNIQHPKEHLQYEFTHFGGKSTSREGEWGDGADDGEEGEDSGEHFQVDLFEVISCVILTYLLTLMTGKVQRSQQSKNATLTLLRTSDNDFSLTNIFWKIS